MTGTVPGADPSDSTLTPVRAHRPGGCGDRATAGASARVPVTTAGGGGFPWNEPNSSQVSEATGRSLP